MTKKPDFSLENEVVKRSNTTIGISPRTAGNLTLLVRRLFNVLVHFTLKDGEKETYRRPLREVLRYIDYNSNDLDRIKEHLEMMASTPIAWDTSTDDDDIWSVASLISGASIIKPKKKGLPAHIEWSFAPKIREKLRSPGQWTQLSLIMHTKLKSGASIALFEICARYETSPGRLTMRRPYEWWHPALTGVRAETVPEYKYFKRDVLRQAIAEINTHADFTVELIEHKVANRVAELQFSITRKPAAVVSNEEAPRFDGELLEQVIRLGLSQPDAQRICEQHDAPTILAAVEYTAKRAAKNPPLESTAAYFRSAIKGRYKETVKPQKAQQQGSLDLADPQTEMDRLTAEYATQQRNDAHAYWRELDAEPAKALIAEFLATNPTALVARAIKKDLLEQAIARTAFTQWLANKLWGEPTADDLLKFSLTKKS
ncbi:replication initiation protein [Burkholderia anthina]|uniref:replication initiation protein n=1 Tax=Burkholderia anthina TaxID=179879 RepID=UPI00158A9D5B|nr:replication initiation protein [Burkholderia anthina]